MLSNKPYLLRAFYDWIVDSGCVPLMVINALHKDCFVPQEYVENGEITLNVSPGAIREMNISNTHVGFQASFSGVVHIISAPMSAISAVYAQENGQGMFFDPEEESDSDSWGGSDIATADQVQAVESTTTASTSRKNVSHLTVIK